MQKTATVLSILALGVLFAPRSADAQVQVGPTVAFHDDFDLGIGGALNVRMPALGDRIGLGADLIVFFPEGDGVDYLEFNGNLTYDFPLENQRVRPFALVGMNIARLSVDLPGELGSAEDTEIGVNLGGGLAFDLGFVRPTVGARAEIGGGEGFVLFMSLPFEVGGN